QLERQGGKETVDRYAEFGYRLPDDVRHSVSGSRPPSRSSPSSPGVGVGAPIARATFERDESLPPETSSHHPDETKGEPASKRDSTDSLKQMLAVIDAERTAHAQHYRELQERQRAERDACVARVEDLQSTLAAERAAFAARTEELQGILA